MGDREEPSSAYLWDKVTVELAAHAHSGLPSNLLAYELAEEE